ncbi:tetratricopeptide repeat protein [Peristeroidobacter soli]|uniref:tetratricopeptide repeat protein n=1 Tax=Peristeroidobacter soli TaxID=2497877 RepID=UPI00101D4EBA|nr:tetratricopeptide repeat protein [Peristeroidobacter soli]
MNTSIATARFSQAELDELHRMAHGAYLQGRYDQAVRYFWFISLHAPTDLRYLKGLAAGLFMSRAFSEAFVAYSYLRQTAPEDPEVSCMLGNTLLLLGQQDEAKAHLEQAIRLPGAADEITTRAHALLEFIAD